MSECRQARRCSQASHLDPSIVRQIGSGKFPPTILALAST